MHILVASDQNWLCFESHGATLLSSKVMFGTVFDTLLDNPVGTCNGHAVCCGSVHLLFVLAM